MSTVRDCVPALSDERIEILSSRAGGQCVGAPATRDEERAMAVEIMAHRRRKDVEHNKQTPSWAAVLSDVERAEAWLSMTDATPLVRLFAEVRAEEREACVEALHLYSCACAQILRSGAKASQRQGEVK